MSQFFTSGGQRIGVSASASVPPMNIQDWFSLELTGLILQSRSLFQHHSSKASVLWHSAFFMVGPTLTSYMTTTKTIALTRWTFVGKVMSLFFNMVVGWAFLIAQLVKNPPAMQDTWVRSLGWEDALEKGKATHSSILALENSTYYSPWGFRVRHNWMTFTFTFHFLGWS